jgi:hypothetical protein
MGQRSQVILRRDEESRRKMNTTPMKYTYREEGCDQCGTSNVETILTENNSKFPIQAKADKINLCCFCYGTLLGNILQYPDQYRGLTTFTQGLIQALHIIKKEVKG